MNTRLPADGVWLFKSFVQIRAQFFGMCFIVISDLSLYITRDAHQIMLYFGNNNKVELIELTEFEFPEFDLTGLNKASKYTPQSDQDATEGHKIK